MEGVIQIVKPLEENLCFVVCLDMFVKLIFIYVNHLWSEKVQLDTNAVSGM